MKPFYLFFMLYFPFLLVAQKQNKDIQRADAYFEVGQFNNAVKYYLYGKRKENLKYVFHQLSKCYRKLNQPYETVNYLKKLSELEPLDHLKEYELAQALKIIGSYVEAKKIFIKLSKKFPEEFHYKDQITSCDSALIYKRRSNAYIYKVKNLETINSKYSEISPFRSKNQLIFSSNREDYILQNRPGGGELPFFSLYTADNVIGRAYSPIKNFAIDGTDNEHKSSISFNNEGNKIFYTQHTSSYSRDSTENFARLKIFFLEKINGHWRNPHSFIFNDSTDSFAHPYLTEDEKMFFFASDMKGGVGGMDIYVCILKDSLWSMPINLGAPVNSPGNEIYPYYRIDNQTLYFSSDYHPGWGGYDIFQAIEKNGELVLKNFQPPINSSYDDFGLVWEDGLKSGYFVSNRPKGKGKEDIYWFYKME